MKKLYAAVSPRGDFDFNTIMSHSNQVKINPSDAKYGNIRVRPVNMKRYTGILPQVEHDYELWQDHKIAWVWINPDGSYWFDTLSLLKEDTRQWCSKPETMIALGFKIVPVKFSIAMIPQLMAA